MRSKIYLCSHRYWAFDPILAFDYFHENNILKKNENILVITSQPLLGNISLNLGNVNYESVLTSKNNYNASIKIKEKIEKGYSIIIFYTKYKIKSGILRILKSEEFDSNHIFEIYTLNINIKNMSPIIIRDKTYLSKVTTFFSSIPKIRNINITLTKWALDIKNTHEEDFLIILKKKLYPELT